MIDTPTFTSYIYPTVLNIAGAKFEHQPKLDGIDLAGVIKGSRSSRLGMGFWHDHTSGQSTRSDQIIKTLMDAQQSGASNPFPERILKNVAYFPTFKEGDLKGVCGLDSVAMEAPPDSERREYHV